MSVKKFQDKIALVIWAIFFLTNFPPALLTKAENGTQLSSRDFVSVWFRSPFGIEPYTKSRIEVMITLMARTFGSITMKSVPGRDYLYPAKNIYNSEVLVPVTAAEHNKKSVQNQRMKVMVSFDLFDTLLLHHDDYLRVQGIGGKGDEEVPPQLHSAWMELNQNGNKMYKLAVTVSLNLCENVGSSSNLLQKFVSYADIIIPVIYVGSTGNFTPCEEHDRQLELIQKCETNVKQIKADVEVIPIVICRKSVGAGVNSTFGQCWQLMSDWAKRNQRKVIMYEAFDRVAGEYVGGNGWWNLKYAYGYYTSEASFEKRPQAGPVSCASRIVTEVNSTELSTSMPDLNVMSSTEKEVTGNGIVTIVPVAFQEFNVTSTPKPTSVLNPTGEVKTLTDNDNAGIHDGNNTDTAGNTIMIESTELYLGRSGIHDQSDIIQEAGSDATYTFSVVLVIFVGVLAFVLNAYFYFKRNPSRTTVSYSRHSQGEELVVI
ncbi:unnamed protein product [Orchesella dallaii]|uniref:Uncharacterized protein n=1 Tax=Orchesella dallaii TaxID=48710 RepID=A0ABP1S7N4_9HEXA